MSDNRKAALDAALKKIEKDFGKGSVMKLGEKVDTQISTVSSGELLKSMVQRVLVKQRLPYMLLPQFKKLVERLHLLMRNTH